MVKKGIIIIIFFCFLIGLVFMLSNNKEKEFRVRIISNSNSELDQQEKQIVKKELEKILNYQKETNYLEIEKMLIKETNGKIKNKIKVTIQKSYYPAKSYEGKFIPSGYYNTLLITIGEGKGSNFWTLLYPEYFNVTFDENNEIEYRIFIIDFIKKILKI